MRIPDSLASLADYGIIEEVLRPLMSGKEAQVYLVVSAGQYRVAKVYKQAENRTFKHRSDYTEGRRVRNSRDQRAMGKNSRHGRAQAEAAWRATEVDMIYRLRDAGVRVPTPHHFIDGVLVMEMITDAAGNPAPRLGDLDLEAQAAWPIFERLLAEVVRMLAAGVVHGDLSDFNVLMGTDGPVLIDFPQAVDASSNRNARRLLLRDVDNLYRFLGRFDPSFRAPRYAEEMWQLYERGQLTADTRLLGRYRPEARPADTRSVLGLISEAARDERRRRELAAGSQGAFARGDRRGEAQTSGAEGHRSHGRREPDVRPRDVGPRGGGVQGRQDRPHAERPGAEGPAVRRHDGRQDGVRTEHPGIQGAPQGTGRPQGQHRSASAMRVEGANVSAGAEGATVRRRRRRRRRPGAAPVAADPVGKS